MKKKIALLFVGLFCLFGAGWLVTHDTITEFRYEGKLIFSTESEYSAFKEAIARPEIKIKDIKALSSEPPIVVQFEIITPASQPFEYGIQWINGSKNVPFVFLLGLIGLVISLTCGILIAIRGAKVE